MPWRNDPGVRQPEIALGGSLIDQPGLFQGHLQAQVNRCRAAAAGPMAVGAVDIQIRADFSVQIGDCQALGFCVGTVQQSVVDELFKAAFLWRFRVRMIQLPLHETKLPAGTRVVADRALG